MTAGSNAPTALIVEDSAEMRHILRDLFCEAGFRVYEAENGESALRHLDLLPRPDMIATDMYMTPINGVDLVTQMRQRPGCADIAVVIISADPDLADIAQNLGVKDYCAKDGNMLGALKEILKRFAEYRCLG